MSWRVKIWYFNAGIATCFAIIFAAAGYAACFGFGLWAAANWYLGNLVSLREKKGE